MCVPGLFGGSTPKPPKPPPPPSPSAAEIGQADMDERRRRALAGGRGSTILTGNLGGLPPAPTSRPTLGGGGV